MSGNASAAERHAPGPIYLVEDDPLSLKLMADVLQAHAFPVETFINGLDLLTTAERTPPALVVVDIGLPGIDGIEVTRRLKASPATSAVPIIAVTAYAMQRDEQEMRAAGCDAFLAKPIRLAEFVRVVQALLAERSTATI